MISNALWYIHQWNRARWGGELSRDMMEHGDKDSLATSFGIIGHAFGTGLVPATIIGTSPYAALQYGSMAAEDYLARKAYLGEHASWSLSKARWTYSRSFSRRLIAKGAAKVATRFIPIVGWGLFAYDLYNVGKWYLESDVDPLGLRS
jgi:hypothetical protein